MSNDVVTFSFQCGHVSTAELEDLFRDASLSGRVGDKIRRAFLNSALVCLAYEQMRRASTANWDSKAIQT
jgi:hypothetical protein